MNTTIKTLLLHYLTRLETLLGKLNEQHFNHQLADDMFSLAINARIAANMALRCYCSVVGVETPDLDSEQTDKAALCHQLSQTIAFINGLPDIAELDDSKTITEQAGLAKLTLPQSEFVYQFALPNLLFHFSMVYANARAAGAPLSKGDFDGYHQYPAGFSFTE